MSTHEVLIHEMPRQFAHPNADKLAITTLDNYQVVVRKDDYSYKQSVVYIAPDYEVDVRYPSFAFLMRDSLKKASNNWGDGSLPIWHRVKAIRLRGELSYGLLVPLPEGFEVYPVGTNVLSVLPVRRYVPPEPTIGGNAIPSLEWPVGVPKFDVESAQKYGELFAATELVVVTEKVHGTNARYAFNPDTNKFNVGSRNLWIDPEGDSVYAKIAKRYPGIEKFCRETGCTLYGEIYGNVQSLKYGLTDFDFVVFAAYHPRMGTYMNHSALFKAGEANGLPYVPVLQVCRYAEVDWHLAEMDSSIPSAPAGHMREGVVVKPLFERVDPKIGRVCVKHISDRYLLGGDI